MYSIAYWSLELNSSRLTLCQADHVRVTREVKGAASVCTHALSHAMQTVIFDFISHVARRVKLRYEYSEFRTLDITTTRGSPAGTLQTSAHRSCSQAPQRL